MSVLMSYVLVSTFPTVLRPTVHPSKCLSVLVSNPSHRPLVLVSYRRFQEDRGSRQRGFQGQGNIGHRVQGYVQSIVKSAQGTRQMVLINDYIHIVKAQVTGYKVKGIEY